MTNPSLPKATDIGKAVTLLAAIALAGFGVVPVVFADRQPQTETIAPPSIDPNWLLTPEPAGLPVALGQADLFAEEIHRALIQSEAARMVSQAHSMVGDERFESCYAKSVEDCFDSIEQSIRQEWLDAIEHEAKARALFRWQALQVARTGNVEPPAMALDATFLQLSDKLATERSAAMSSSVEGASRFRQIETQLDRLNNAPLTPPEPNPGDSTGQSAGPNESGEPSESDEPDNPTGETDDNGSIDEPASQPNASESPEDEGKPASELDDETAAETDAADPPDEEIETEAEADNNSEAETSIETDRNREGDSE
ncbi:MAG: hypothetical protein ACFB9N_14740 [Geitlerinemataceae cyanobacterium]